MVGLVCKITSPVPDSSVIAAAKLALEAVAKNVATPAPRPEIPVLTGNPVAFVSTPLAGVPSAGVTNTGDVAKTSAPDPVSSVTQVIKLALDGVASQAAQPAPSPEMPVLIGSPVAFVNTPLAGVPRAGAISVGPLFRTTRPVPDSSLITPANCADVVEANCESGLAVNPRPEGKSPSTSKHGAKVVPALHVPMTWCEA